MNLPFTSVTNNISVVWGCKHHLCRETKYLAYDRHRNKHKTAMTEIPLERRTRVDNKNYSQRVRVFMAGVCVLSIHQIKYFIRTGDDFFSYYVFHQEQITLTLLHLWQKFI